MQLSGSSAQKALAALHRPPLRTTARSKLVLAGPDEIECRRLHACDRGSSFSWTDGELAEGGDEGRALAEVGL